jgi:collagenase-like PrtC family protease
MSTTTDRWRTKKIIEQELELAKLGRKRTLTCNKVLYNDRIKRLERELKEVTD